MLRAERIRIATRGDAASGPGQRSVDGVVKEVEYLGAFIHYIVEADGGAELLVNQPNLGGGAAQRNFARGAEVTLSWADAACHRIGERSA
jgi:putative spermidine/putrescine transport system ATP-binding protein